MYNHKNIIEEQKKKLFEIIDEINEQLSLNIDEVVGVNWCDGNWRFNLYGKYQ